MTPYPTRLEIVRLGHPALRAKSRRLSRSELMAPETQTFLTQLAELCLASNGAGIAAPQVGVNVRAIVVHVDPKNPRYPGKKAFPLTVLVNPVVKWRSGEKNEDWEGDLSAGIRAKVPRASACIVSGLTPSGKSVVLELSYDFHARVFQHEIDHLDGKFFVDRVRDKTTITETAEWEKFWRPS